MTDVKTVEGDPRTTGALKKVRSITEHQICSDWFAMTTELRDTCRREPVLVGTFSWA